MRGIRSQWPSQRPASGGKPGPAGALETQRDPYAALPPVLLAPSLLEEWQPTPCGTRVGLKVATELDRRRPVNGFNRVTGGTSDWVA